jgi:DNA end-binding protein Ku
MDLPPSAASEAERELARQLITLVSTPLDWTRYHDTSAEELAALVEAKVAKQPPQFPADEPVVVLHLMDALKQSIEQARNGSAEPASKGRKPRGQGRRAEAPAPAQGIPDATALIPARWLR